MIAEHETISINLFANFANAFRNIYLMLRYAAMPAHGASANQPRFNISMRCEKQHQRHQVIWELEFWKWK